MTSYGQRHSVFPPTPSGMRPSVQRVRDLIDTSDPSWPSVAAVLREFADAGIDIDETTAVMAVKLGKRRWAGPGDGNDDTPAIAVTAPGSIVYYVRRGELIKIGTTARPLARFRDLLPDEILAVEPGGHQVEAARHRQFAHLRGHGEYFRDAAELRDHIDRIQSLHGEPDPTWPTSKSRQRDGTWQMPQAVTADAMTTAQAAAELGIKENTIRGWAHRGRLSLAGRDERGRYLYYREHLIALRDNVGRRLVTRAF